MQNDKTFKLKLGVIITAGGRGERLPAAVKKQYLDLHGKPILQYSLDLFTTLDFDNIIITAPIEDIGYIKKNFLNKNHYKNTIVVNGGATRQKSVYNGLQQLTKSCNIVYIHDAVRPFATKRLILNLLDDLKKIQHDNNIAGIIPCIKVKDTIKQINAENIIISTPNREFLYAAQTPQVFKYDILIKAYKKFKNKLDDFTDDSAIIEKFGYKVKISNGEETNIKITTLFDFKIADIIKTEISEN